MALTARPRGLGLARDLRLRQPGDVDNQGWLLGDYRNSVRYVLNSTHADAAIEYDSFGQVLGGTTPAEAHSLVGYIGQVFDVETGLGYFNARYYDPATGRFLSEDPIGFAGGDTNLYRYVGNDSINRIDPSGLSWLSKAIDVVVEFGKDVDDFVNKNGGWAVWGLAPLLVPTISIGAFSFGSVVLGGDLSLGFLVDAGALVQSLIQGTATAASSVSGGVWAASIGLTAGIELAVAGIGAAIHGRNDNSSSDNSSSDSEQFEPPAEAYQAYVPPIIYPMPQSGGAWSDYMSDVDIRPYTTIQLDIPATFGIPQPKPPQRPALAPNGGGRASGLTAGGIASAVWDTVKFWDNADVAADFANLRASGYSALGAAYGAVGNAAGKFAGVAGVADLLSGRDESGRKLGWGERAWAGASGSFQLAGTATGAYKVGAAIYKGGAAAAAAVFGTPSRGASFVDQMTPAEAARYRAYWSQELNGPTRQRLQVAPGYDSITDMKISSQTGQPYTRQTIYDVYGRAIGVNDFTTHGRPSVHANPHHHTLDPLDNFTHSSQKPGLHPGTPKRP